MPCPQRPHQPWVSSHPLRSAPHRWVATADSTACEKSEPAHEGAPGATATTSVPSSDGPPSPTASRTLSLYQGKDHAIRKRKLQAVVVNWFLRTADATPLSGSIAVCSIGCAERTVRQRHQRGTAPNRGVSRIRVPGRARCSVSPSPCNLHEPSCRSHDSLRPQIPCRARQGKRKCRSLLCLSLVADPT